MRKCTLRNPNQRVNAHFQGVNHPLTRLIWTNDIGKQIRSFVRTRLRLRAKEVLNGFPIV